jgi:hypothetical protein
MNESDIISGEEEDCEEMIPPCGSLYTKIKTLGQYSANVTWINIRGFYRNSAHPQVATQSQRWDIMVKQPDCDFSKQRGEILGGVVRFPLFALAFPFWAMPFKGTAPPADGYFRPRLGASKTKCHSEETAQTQ